MIILKTGKKVISTVGKKWKEMEIKGREDAIAGELLAGLRDSRLRINTAERENLRAELFPGSTVGTPEEEYRRRDDLIGDFERRISAKGLSRGRIVRKIVRSTGYCDVTLAEADLGFEAARDVSIWESRGFNREEYPEISNRYKKTAIERGLDPDNVLGEVVSAILSPFDAYEM